MTRLLFLFIATISLFNPAKADTIDYWHVYYNDSLIGEYTEFSNRKIVLKADDIKRRDTLTIFFFSDTPCNDCETEVIVSNMMFEDVYRSKISAGNNTPLKISVKSFARRGEGDYFEFNYYEVGESPEQLERILLFTIKLE